jgi:outer membrane protein assembly factor BamD (BamD/ComL family)
MKLYIPLTLAALIVFTGCSKPTPEEYVGKATVAINEKNFVLAVEEYEKLIADHPKSVQAEMAMFTVAKIHSDELKNFPKAIDAYKRYVEMYPEGKQAPLAMFLTAYIYHNEMNDLGNAKIAYEAFLAKFPDHEMALSARFELQNLGKKPEELLPAIQQSAPQTASQTPNPRPAKKK